MSGRAMGQTLAEGDVCEIEGCEKPRRKWAKRHLCEAHHAMCSINGCDQLRYGRRSMCSKHEARISRHGDPDFVTPLIKVSASDRFWSKVAETDPSKCWIYGGTILNTGYGQISFGKNHRESAHRFAYEDRVGPIPDGLTIDHLCRERACVNPSHMEPVTQSVNSQRVHLRARGINV